MKMAHILNSIGMAFDINVLNISEISCNLGAWMRFAFEDIIYWVLLWITINRIASITCVTRLSWITTVRSTCIALGTIALYSIVYNSHSLLVYNREKKLDPATNRTTLSCTIYVDDLPRGVFSTTIQIIGFLEPLVPLSLLFVSSVFLAYRLIAIASKRRKLLAKKVSVSHENQESIRAIQNSEQREAPSEERWRRKEVQLAMLIISFSVAEILIEGTSDIVGTIRMLLRSINRDDVLFDEKVSTLRTINQKLEDASILLRIWHFVAYLVIMPSFRHAVIDFLKYLRIWKFKEVS